MPSFCPGKYANNQSSLGSTEITVGGSYDAGDERTGAGDGRTNCFEDKTCRPVTNGCVGCAVSMIEDWDHSKGLEDGNEAEVTEPRM